MSIDCFILGFNHNAAKEGNNRIHFGIGKSGNKLVGLVDEKYNKTVSETGYFSMNSSMTNAGGWRDCRLRNVVLQGTTTPNYPLDDVMLAALPFELRAVMKSVTKYTDNVGNGNGTGNSVESNVTATTDYLFIPSEYEVFASSNVSNIYEASYQAQYDYWKSGNSKIMYKYNDTSAIAFWWLRSLNKYNDSGFCLVRASGNLTSFEANCSYAILPCFCV